ncbi:MAG: hypothetical protein ACKO0Z_28605 [Betaproteobacteria bacterium]
MKFLFIENREKTLFWDKVALSLEGQGHTVHWLIQNHKFRPNKSLNTAATVLPYPSIKKEAIDDEEMWIRENHPFLIADRGRTFFHAGIGHYDCYKSAIGDVLNNYQPDLVVGESTLFHELLAIHLCKEKGIAYVQPMSNRYPRGRFSLLSFDSQIPIVESKEEWSHEQALDLAKRIATSTEVPFYMSAPTGSVKLRQQLAWVAARGRVWLGRLGGERYNTPSLSRKLELRQMVRRNLMRWNALERLPKAAKQTVLYPMQLQPESNIDVWGRPYSDQVDFIKRLLSAIPENFEIAIKANPKAKYELTDEFLMLAEKEKRICLLPVRLPMSGALEQALGAITITGTIGFEAMCGKGRALSLRHPIIENEFPAFHAETPEVAVRRIVEDPHAGVGNIEIGAKLIQRFVNQSFPGIVGDPISYPSCMNQKNISAVAAALMCVQPPIK